MVKYRVNITVMDYYSYVGTHNPHCSVKSRIMSSLPYTLKKHGYNMRFKKVKGSMWDSHIYYRVHISFKGNEEQWSWILKDVENLSHLYSNFSYKEIKVAKGH